MGGPSPGASVRMDLKLNGRKALVTGASKGIGAACAEALAQEGCAVVLVARDGEALNAVKARIQAAGCPIGIEALDLSDSRNVDRLAEAHPDVDILVNNAGAIPAGRLHEIDEEAWRRAWDLKVFGYVNMCRRFYGTMQARGGVLATLGLRQMAGSRRAAAGWVSLNMEQPGHDRPASTPENARPSPCPKIRLRRRPLECDPFTADETVYLRTRLRSVERQAGGLAAGSRLQKIYGRDTPKKALQQHCDP